MSSDWFKASPSFCRFRATAICLLTQSFFAWLTGQSRSGKENLFFDVILHLGTTAAILFYHRKSIVQGWRGLSGGLGCRHPGFSRLEVVRVGLLAAVATSPLVPFALFFKKPLEQTFEGTTVAGYGFLVTAAVLLVTAWLEPAGRSQGAGHDVYLDDALRSESPRCSPRCRGSAAVV